MENTKREFTHFEKSFRHLSPEQVRTFVDLFEEMDYIELKRQKGVIRGVLNTLTLTETKGMMLDIIQIMQVELNIREDV